MSNNTSKKIIVGRFGAAFGIKGWITVISFTVPPENILNYRPWLIEESASWKAITPDEGKLHSKGVVVKLPGCDDRDQARTYTNKEIAITEDLLPDLPPNEFYWDDLIGLEVTNQEHEILGVVYQIMATGANDVLVVRQDSKERLIPYIKHVIIAVDLEKKQITVDWASDF